jgi:hypothetical protein
MLGIALALVGCLAGFAGVVLALVLIAVLVKPRRLLPSVRARHYPSPTSESAQWVNVTLARVGSVRLDRFAMEALCRLIADAFASDPSRPGFLSELALAPLQSPARTPVFSDFRIVPADDGAALHIRMSYEPAASVGVAVAASLGPAALPDVVRVALKVELLLELLVADFRVVRDAGGLSVVVGNDFVVDVHCRPMYDAPGSGQRKFVDGLSGWLSRAISFALKGKKVALFAFPDGCDE